jgi:hypothetical protein
MNATSFVKYSKPLFYACKQYDLLLNKQCIPKTTTLSWLFFEKFYLSQTCKKTFV